MQTLSGCRVLVVDDDPRILSIMSHVLRRAGATVQTAVDGCDALRKFAQAVPDVLLSDLFMPNMNGIDLIHHVREHYPSTVPVVLTASVKREDAIAAIKEGVFDFVEKSGTGTSGAEFAVRRAADRARILRERQELLEELRVKNEQLEAGMKRLQTAYAGLREQDAQLQDDMARAQQIQRRMLPAEFPRVGCYDFAAYYRPCDWLGGDFFGHIPLSDSRVGFYLADVSGHGVTAAMVTVELREMIRAQRRRDDGAVLFEDPPATLEFLNRTLWGEFSHAAIHVTMFYGIVDADKHVLAYASAGHPTPLLDMADTYGALPQVPGVGLALRPDATYESGCIDIAPGTLLLAYSDGLLEAPDVHGNCLTRDDLSHCFAGGSDARDVADRVVARFTDHVDGQVLPDDVSILAVHRGTSDAPPSPKPTVTFATTPPAAATASATLPASQLARAELEDATVIRLSGRVSWQIGMAVQDQFGTEPSTSGRVVVDLGQCESLDSTMLGMLCRLPAGVEVAGLHGDAAAQVRELGIWDLLRHGSMPSGHIDFTPVKVVQGDTGEQARMILHAHEALSDSSDANRKRFADVVDMLREETEDSNDDD